jgi:hypothetical protein
VVIKTPLSGPKCAPCTMDLRIRRNASSTLNRFGLHPPRNLEPSALRDICVANLVLVTTYVATGTFSGTSQTRGVFTGTFREKQAGFANSLDQAITRWNVRRCEVSFVENPLEPACSLSLSNVLHAARRGFPRTLVRSTATGFSKNRPATC